MSLATPSKRVRIAADSPPPRATPSKRPANGTRSPRSPWQRARQEEDERLMELLPNLGSGLDGEEEEDDDEEGWSEDEEAIEDDADEDEEPAPATSSKRKRRAPLTIKKKKASKKPIVALTASDAYFIAHSAPPRPSTTPFPLPPLTAAATREALARAPLKAVVPAATHEARWGQWLCELERGFDLLFYGVGSKRGALNAFAKRVLRKRGELVVVNGFFPSLGIRDVLGSIESLPSISRSSAGTTSSTPEASAARIHAQFSKPDTRQLFLLIHNIDAPSLRNPRSLALLVLLASAPQLHVVASIDHLNAPLLFPPDSIRWAWHDLTTLEPYTMELSFRSTSLLGSGTSAGAGAGLAAQGTSEAAAKHVLVSVQAKARKLFRMLGEAQLAAQPPTGSGATTGTPVWATSRAQLAERARSQFIATSEDAFRALLAEFRDHGMVLSATAPPPGEEGVGEWLWVPLGAKELDRVVKGIEKDD